jgi:hypothetical protein
LNVKSSSEPCRIRCINFTAVAVGVFLLSLVFAVVTARSLYDDGTHYFMRVLQAGGFTEMLFSRGHAAYLYQLPVVIALKLGVTNLGKLQLAFGVGCFCTWPLAMWLCHRLAPPHFWLVVLACSSGYLNAAFVAVGEHVVTHAFFWPVVFVLLFVRPLTLFAAVVLLISSAILLRTYESMLFLGPVLAWLAFRRAQSEAATGPRVVCLVAAVILLLSVPIAMDGILHPCTGSNANSFKTGFFSVLLSPGWTISWTAGWLGLMLAGVWQPKLRAWITSRVGIFLLGAGILFWGAWPLLAPAQLDPYKQYEARFLDLLVPLALLAVAMFMNRFPSWLVTRKNYLVNMSAALLLAQSLWQLAATEQWRGFLHVLQDLMASRSGIVMLMDTPYGRQPAVGGQATRFVWVMDLRNLCVEISPRRVQALVLGDPFIDQDTVNRIMLDGYLPKYLPELDRYGVDYHEYLRAFNPEELKIVAPAPK